jgi:hypothetical protein
MTTRPISDRDLNAAFNARAAGAPSPDLAERIHVAAASTRQSRPFLVLPGFANPAVTRLAWAAVLSATIIALVGVLAFGAGNRAPITAVDPSDSPTVSPLPSDEPSGEPSGDPTVEPSPTVDPSVPPSATPELPSGSPSVGGFPPVDGLGIVVATDGLRVRSKPGVGADSERLDPTLDEGTRFYVVAGPVEADGYQWIQIDPYTGDPGLPFGWVAVGSREGEPWVAPFELGCDSVGITPEGLLASERLEMLYCHRDADLTVSGEIECAYGDVEGLSTGPEWLEFDRYCVFVVGDQFYGLVGKPLTSLLDAANPNGEGNSVRGFYEIVGHFDDPGAQECESGGFDGDTMDPAQVILNCRTAFVVTEVISGL